MHTLQGKRVLITQAEDFMGPALCEVFAQQGAEVIANAQALSPPEVQDNPRFQERLAREMPLGPLVGAREDAMFTAYLCRDAANCFVGQVIPVCGGWVGR